MTNTNQLPCISKKQLNFRARALKKDKYNTKKKKHNKNKSTTTQLST